MPIDTKLRKHRGRLNSKSAISRARVELSNYVHFGNGNEIVPFGLDNLYPNRIIDAIRESPTSKGCIKRLEEFVFGQGITMGGDIHVNRTGETLNDILSQSIRDYSKLSGFCLHFNFDALGQIVEIFNVQMMYVRKHKTLDKVDIGVWDKKNTAYYGQQYITIDLYKSFNPVKRMMDEGVDFYKGQLLYFSKNSEIYPDATLEGSSLSAEYERESQLYPYANIKNGFSGNTIIKLPTLFAGEKSQGQVDTLQTELLRLHGSENAGGSIVVPVTVGDSGEPKDFKMVENLTPTSADNLFVNQNASAERNLLKTYTMPEILLGVSSQGMFNQAAFNDAFNYKNADTEGDRKIVEREFNKFLPKTAFPVNNIEIKPLEMKVGSELADSVSITKTLGADDTVETSNLGNETLRGISGRQKQQLISDINKYKNGKINRAQAEVLLGSYGLTDDDINKMLNDD